ncbi:hypothetical protein [Hyphomonas jannaschiana]|uniref:hypothetical protein n=1 Tax=Hyphomonas jannaschiana TaxID=86 RepID=UPI0012DF6666|nr:hypothetical protein [Hyphomonas jannaschiana]
MGYPLNTHILKDKLFLAIINLLGKPFFSGSAQSAAFLDHLDAISLDLPKLERDGSFIKVPAHGLAGFMEAGLRVIHDAGADAPVVIYHQGGGEIPFDHTISAAYPSGSSSGTTVIAVKTPFQTTQEELRDRFVDFNNYVAMIACVVKLTEALLQSTELTGAACKVVAGYSLGGFVSGRHHIIYNTADAYIPFVSGTAHAEIFLTTVKAAAKARRNPEMLRSRLNFTEAWKKADNSNVFPVLGRYDQLNRLTVQGPSYCGTPFDLWPGGHLYGVQNPQLIRQKIEAVIARFCPSRARA